MSLHELGGQTMKCDVATSSSHDTTVKYSTTGSWPPPLLLCPALDPKDELYPMQTPATEASNLQHLLPHLG